MECIFVDKAAMPIDRDLKEKLGSTYSIWNGLKHELIETHANPSEE